MPAPQLIGRDAAMLEGFSKREILIALGGLIVIVVLGTFGGAYLAKYLAGDHSNDPPGRAGGTKPAIQTK
jgi:hypothetical protein